MGSEPGRHRGAEHTRRGRSKVIRYGALKKSEEVRVAGANEGKKQEMRSGRKRGQIMLGLESYCVLVFTLSEMGSLAGS